MKLTIFKQIAIGFTALALVLGSVACVGIGAGASASSLPQTDVSGGASEAAVSAVSTSSGAETAGSAANAEAYFSDSDYKDVSTETPDAEIVLSGSEGTISDTARGTSGAEVTITGKGIYHVTGSSENVTIVIRDEKESGKIYLILDGVTMTNDTGACIRAEACDKLVIFLIGDNSLTDANTDETAKVDGAIYAKDDVTVSGSGTLTIRSGLHGIVCNDDLKLTGATVSITAGAIGMKAGDSVRVDGAQIEIAAGHDGIQVSNEEGDAFFYIGSGSVTVDAGYDGIDVGSETDEFTGAILLDGGTVNITAGGGSSNAQNDSVSQKGVKCQGAILLSGAAVSADSADDAIHSDGDITINGGSVTLASSDDGIHAENELVINAGTVTVTGSYEGLEAYVVMINGGDVQVYACDDGINAAGGSDTQSAEAWGWGRGRDGSNSTGTLYINGGTVYVNASGDGLDSNGSLYVTGGLTIVEGPTNSGNGALDFGDGGGYTASITGGTVLAIGASGMAVNFSEGSQCSALVNLSGGAGTTIAVDDGSGFTFTATKSFQCAVYSSPSLAQGGSYTITAGNASATMDFSGSLYCNEVGGFGGFGGGPGFGGKGGRH